MVARYSDGEKYAEHAAAVTSVRNSADDLRELALTLAEDDATAFGAVGDAYALPRSTGEEKAARSQAIAASLAEAGRVPGRVVAVAERVVGSRYTRDLAEHTRSAEILVVAVGRIGLIGTDHVSAGAVVVDVGTNPTADGGLAGDVDAAAVTDLVAGLTPVPGGVGRVTTALLLRHTVESASRSAI
ncbi:formiminotransferase-cyclodeaminase [Saccharopolyspora spinosa]|uniref:methenyltetrahydrofolate cyclohydrolase n=1 Tax=Saccharopolyspora spinosa TaxID=60894 RepID=A0A2N3Y2G3_SACSN|nr:formiminotransferase-cyclodeaminase [Saccharopolyspora spinosa]